MITLKTIFLGVICLITIVIGLVAFLLWIDSMFPEPDEHTDTDNSRG